MSKEKFLFFSNLRGFVRVVIGDIEVENEFSAAIESLIRTNDKFEIEQVTLITKNRFARAWQV